MIIEQVKPWVKTSLAPGSGVVTKYLLQRYKLEPLNRGIHHPFSSSVVLPGVRHWILFMTSCSGLQKYLNQQGFHIVGYGCTTCIGNSGDLDESVASAIAENGMSFLSFCLFISWLYFHLGLLLRIYELLDNYFQTLSLLLYFLEIGTLKAVFILWLEQTILPHLHWLWPMHLLARYGSDLCYALIFILVLTIFNWKENFDRLSSCCN